MLALDDTTVWCINYKLCRLREIEMSEHDADMYAKIIGKVRNQIQALRVMLSSIEVYPYPEI